MKVSIDKQWPRWGREFCSGASQIRSIHSMDMASALACEHVLMHIDAHDELRLTAPDICLPARLRIARSCARLAQQTHGVRLSYHTVLPALSAPQQAFGAQAADGSAGGMSAHVHARLAHNKHANLTHSAHRLRTKAWRAQISRVSVCKTSQSTAMLIMGPRSYDPRGAPSIATLQCQAAGLATTARKGTAAQAIVITTLQVQLSKGAAQCCTDKSAAALHPSCVRGLAQVAAQGAAQMRRAAALRSACYQRAACV